MRVTAVVIMRNEAVLIASKLAACATWADQIVCVDQRSEDGSLFTAREVLRLLEIEHEAFTTRSEVLGKEFSYLEGFEAATGDWVVYTDVDEILVARGGFKKVLETVPPECNGPTIVRWHAIVHGDDYFKVEKFDVKRFRILRKPGAEVFDAKTKRYKDLLHKHEPVTPESELPRFDIPQKQAFLMEFKAPHQHFADQLFYEAVGSRNDRKACEEAFSSRELALGRAMYELGHQENAPVRRWWWPFGKGKR